MPSLARTLALAGGLGAAGLVLVGAAYGATYVVTGGNVPHGVQVARIDLGGKSPAEAVTALHRLDAPGRAPLTVVADGVRLPLDPVRAGLSADLGATVTAARRQSPLDRLRSLVGLRRLVAPVVRVDQRRLAAEVARAGAAFDRPAREGAVRFDGTRPVPVLPLPGRTLQQQETARLVQAAYLRTTTVPAPVTVVPVKSSAAGVQAALTSLAVPAVSAPVTLRTPGGDVVVRPSDIAGALTVAADADGAVVGRLDGAKLRSELGSRVAAVETPPRDASFVVQGGTPVVVPSRDGRTVDPVDLRVAVAAVLRSPAPRMASLGLAVDHPDLTTAQAGALGIHEVIGSFTTYHPCCAPRVQNIHRIADIVDGTVLKPGQQFSLNEVVGQRDRSRGFTEAPQILLGELVPAVGGGVSQFTTTLYNAVFFSGLKDVEHHPHSFYISRYPAGRESTVSYPEPNFIFQNDSTHGVLITTGYSDTSVTVTFYGTKRYDVEAVSGPRTNVRPFAPEYVTRPDCTASDGSDGFDIVVTRIFRQHGREVGRENFSTHYDPEPMFICASPPAPRAKAARR